MIFLIPFNKLIEIKKQSNFFFTKKNLISILFQKKHDKKVLKEDKIKNENLHHLKVIVLILTTFITQIGSTKKVSKIFKTSNLNAIEIDTVGLRITREDMLNEKFLFSHKLIQNSSVENDIQEIEDEEYNYKNWRNSQIGLAIGGSILGMWFTFKGLNAWEKWMKDQEQKDIQEEIKMTGRYIHPSAKNLNISVDPVTGKKILVNEKQKKQDEKKFDHSPEDKKE